MALAASRLELESRRPLKLAPDFSELQLECWPLFSFWLASRPDFQQASRSLLEAILAGELVQDEWGLERERAGWCELELCARCGNPVGALLSGLLVLVRGQ